MRFPLVISLVLYCLGLLIGCSWAISLGRLLTASTAGFAAHHHGLANKMHRAAAPLSLINPSITSHDYSFSSARPYSSSSSSSSSSSPGFNSHRLALSLSSKQRYIRDKFDQFEDEIGQTEEVLANIKLQHEENIRHQRPRVVSKKSSGHPIIPPALSSSTNTSYHFLEYVSNAVTASKFLERVLGEHCGCHGSGLIVCVNDLKRTKGIPNPKQVLKNTIEIGNMRNYAIHEPRTVWQEIEKGTTTGASTTTTTTTTTTSEKNGFFQKLELAAEEITSLCSSRQQLEISTLKALVIPTKSDQVLTANSIAKQLHLLLTKLGCVSWSLFDAINCFGKKYSLELDIHYHMKTRFWKEGRTSSSSGVKIGKSSSSSSFGPPLIQDMFYIAKERNSLLHSLDKPALDNIHVFEGSWERVLEFLVHLIQTQTRTST